MSFSKLAVNIHFKCMTIYIKSTYFPYSLGKRKANVMEAIRKNTGFRIVHKKTRVKKDKTMLLQSYLFKDSG